MDGHQGLLLPLPDTEFEEVGATKDSGRRMLEKCQSGCSVRVDESGQWAPGAGRLPGPQRPAEAQAAPEDIP